MNPKVSVIIPVYNVEKYLPQCIDSIINQTLKDIEIICIDDGSTDNSLNILKEYQKKDKRIIIIEQQNGGAGRARNAGLKIAKGTYLSFLDSDDFFYENMLKEAVDNLEKTKSDIIVYNVDLYDNKLNKIIPDNWVIKKDLLPQKQIFSYKDCLETIFTCVHTAAWNKLFRSEFIKKNKLYFQETHNTNDLYFVCMALVLAKEITYLPDALMCYRINLETSLSQAGNRAKYPDDAHAAFKKLKKELLQYDLFYDLKKAYDNACLRVYYYNSNKLKSSDALNYLLKLKLYWLPELEIERPIENYFYYKHFYEFYKKISNLELFSFDIFDTLISRKVILPNVIFKIMQRYLEENKDLNFPEILITNFENIRVTTEKFFYFRICDNLKRDIVIDEIYELIGKNYSLSDKQITFLKELELKIEIDNVVPIKKNIEIIKTLIKEHKRVILISDMYLPVNIIRRLLMTVDNVFENISIYVSCEYNAKKHDGKLFEKIRELENVDYSLWLHFGDNENADYKQPLKLGIFAVLFLYNKLKDYEQMLLNYNVNNLQNFKIIGLIKSLCNNKITSQMEELGASFGGPILFPYVYWVISEANKKNIKNLYFVSRDGYVLKEIADLIIQKYNFNICTFYIYGSRVAWRDPVLNKENDKIILIKNYLKQCLILNQKFAFVEYAGTGQTQDCLVEVLNSIEYDQSNFIGSYYLYHSKNLASQYSSKYSMMRLNENFNPRIELLVRALHGQVLGYKYDENQKIVPQLDNLEGSALINYGYGKYINGIKLYTNELLNLADDDKTLNLFDYSITSIYLTYLRRDRIDTNIVNLLGGIPFILDGTSEKIFEYAPALTKNDVELINSNRSKEIKTNNLTWSIIRSSEAIQKILGEQFLNYNKNSSREKNLQNDLIMLKNSYSFRIGRSITYIPRKIRGGIKCYKEHGIVYTIKRLAFHLGMKNF